MPHTRRFRLLILVAVTAACCAGSGCDERREANNPFGGPTHGPSGYVSQQGPVPWRDAPTPR